MNYTVKEITDEEGWSDFMLLPYTIYKNDPNWIAPQASEARRILDAQKNPYFRDGILKLFVCYHDNHPVCRTAMVTNHAHWVKFKRKSAFFGFLESVNDIKAIDFLFRRVESECRLLGAEYLEGPLNPSHYSELGILTDNFDVPPVFFETYNPPYYPNLLAGTGFRELIRFHTRKNDDMPATLSNIHPERERLPTDIKVRKFNLLRMKRELDLMREINNDAFDGNWYFLPLSREEYRFSARFLFLVTSPGLILFAEYKGKPAGVLQCAVNFNSLIKSYGGKIRAWHLPSILLKRRKLKELTIFTVGIKKSFQHTGVSAALISSAFEILKRYTSVSTTWISDENKSVIHIAELFGMKPYKHFSIYSKPL
jgi:ribosomal protein S18 acetylase RimI-like enzyme